jgi:hypothetical protein
MKQQTKNKHENGQVTEHLNSLRFLRLLLFKIQKTQL